MFSMLVITLTRNAKPGDGGFHNLAKTIFIPLIILNFIFLIQDISYFFTGNLGIIQFIRGQVSIPIAIFVFIIYLIIQKG